MMMDIKEYDGYQRGFGSIIYKCIDKKSASFADKSAAGGSVKKEIEQIKKISWRITILENLKTKSSIIWSYLVHF